MCGKKNLKADHIDCKIIAFKVMKRAFFAPCKIRVNRLWIPSMVKILFLLLKVEVLDMIAVKSVENPWKKKSQKRVIFIP
jgi:hypothetical protein